MMDEVLQAPGKVWEFLRANGECSVSKIKKETKMPDSLIYLGLGWLAKEGKAVLRRDGGSIRACIK